MLKEAGHRIEDRLGVRGREEGPPRSIFTGRCWHGGLGALSDRAMARRTGVEHYLGIQETEGGLDAEQRSVWPHSPSLMPDTSGGPYAPDVWHVLVQNARRMLLVCGLCGRFIS